MSTITATAIGQMASPSTPAPLSAQEQASSQTTVSCQVPTLSQASPLSSVTTNTTSTVRSPKPKTLARSASVSSLTTKPHLVTAPCTRCGHTETIKSLLSIVDTSALNCPYCPENHAVPASVAHPGASELLYRCFADLEADLQRHGSQLHQLSLMRPSVSRESSVRSFRMTDDDNSLHPPRAPSVMGNPLIHDFDDLKNLTSGVTRLLRTLHEKVLRLDKTEKLLREEREELSKIRKELAEEREEIDQLRLELFGRASQKSGEASFPIASRRGKSFDLSPEELNQKSVPMSKAVSFATDDIEPPVIWNDEKELQLKILEAQLCQANKRWSDEQEDVLPMVEQLREERRKAKKQFSRSQSKFDIDSSSVGSETPRRRVSSFGLGRKVSASGRSSRRGSDGSDSGVGSRLIRFFSKKEKEGDKVGA